MTPSSATPPLDYERLRDSLAAAGAVVALAEVHGGVCGAVCAGGPLAAQRWLKECLEDAELAAPATPVQDELEALVSASATMLADRELEFAPLAAGRRRTARRASAGACPLVPGILERSRHDGAERGPPQRRRHPARRDPARFRRDQPRRLERGRGRRAWVSRISRSPRSTSTCASACRSCSKSSARSGPRPRATYTDDSRGPIP